jgi:ATP-dependent DNA helicase RecG
MTASFSIAELLARLNEVDESHEIEAKRSSSEMGKSALETVSAFSNEPGLGGGYIVFGVTESASRVFTATGVTDPKKLEQEISSQCGSVFNRAVRPRIWTEVVDGTSLVAAFVPEASPAEKPVFIKASGMQHGAFRRIGSTDQRCAEDDLRVLFRAGDPLAFEDSCLKDATSDDFSDDVIAAYRRQLLDENPGTELRDASGPALVQAVGGLRHEEGRLCPTVAGVLLFGTRLALRRLFPQLRVDYIRVPGTRWVPDVDHRYDAIEIRDPLLLAFRRAYQAVLDDLPRSFVLDPGSPERRDRAAVPEKVVREALVNAMTHRDYRTPTATQVIRFSDRIEIRNPGRALIGEEQFGQPGSYSRNPRIADVFREMRLAENKGTGIEAMRRAMKAADLTPPVFVSNARTDTFVTTLWLHSLLDENEVAWLGSYGHDFSTAQRQALVVARRTGTITNAGLRELTELDPLGARRELQGLRDLGILDMLGERGGAYYVLRNDPFVSQTHQFGAPLPTDRGELGPDRGELGSDRGGLGMDRGELGADRGEPSTLSEPMRAQLAALGVRPRTEKLRAAIRALCSLRAWKPAELARLLPIDPAKLVERHLGPMVDAGELVRSYPDKPTHPEQAYATKQLPLGGR